MKQIDTREGARRRHRIIALFAVIQCWIKGLDGIVLQRGQLESLLGLERFKRERIGWLREDLKEFFPYQEIFVRQGSSITSLFLSRFPLKPYLPAGRMDSAERIKKMGDGGPTIDLFQMWQRPNFREIPKLFAGPLPFLADFMDYDERVVSSYIALIAQGQIPPNSMFSKVDTKPK